MGPGGKAAMVRLGKLLTALFNGVEIPTYLNGHSFAVWTVTYVKKQADILVVFPVIFHFNAGMRERVMITIDIDNAYPDRQYAYPYCYNEYCPVQADSNYSRRESETDKRS